MFAVDKMPIVHMQRRNSQFQRKVSIRIGKCFGRRSLYWGKDDAVSSCWSDWLRAGQPGFGSRQGRCSPCTTMSRQALCPTQPPVRWCQGVLYADRPCVPLNLLSSGAKVFCVQTGPVSHSTFCPVVPRCCVCRQACVLPSLLSGGAKVLCMQTGPVSHSTSCPVVPRCSHLLQSGRDEELTSHLRMMPRLKLHGAVPPLPHTL
jgi:hypothetical protein